MPVVPSSAAALARNASSVPPKEPYELLRDMPAASPLAILLSTAPSGRPTQTAIRPPPVGVGKVAVRGARGLHHAAAREAPRRHEDCPSAGSPPAITGLLRHGIGLERAVETDISPGQQANSASPLTRP